MMKNLTSLPFETIYLDKCSGIWKFLQMLHYILLSYNKNMKHSLHMKFTISECDCFQNYGKEGQGTFSRLPEWKRLRITVFQHLEQKGLTGNAGQQSQHL